MIKLESITKRFGEKEILRNLSFEVKENEIFALLGPNGCGKTTTLNIISGLIPPDEGQIIIDGMLVNGIRGKKKIHIPPSSRKLGYVFQSLSLFPHMRVFENIAFGLESCRISEQEIKARTKKILEFVGLADFGNYYPHQLSGGQKQRVTLARSIATSPKILLLDEPFSTVDALSKESLVPAFKNLIRELNITTIFVTHDLAEAYIMADRIAILGNGHIEQVGNREEILTKPKSRFIAETLGINVHNKDVVVDKSKPDQLEIAGVPVSASKLNHSPGQALFVTIRPEDVVVLPEPCNDDFCEADPVCNVLTGVIVDILQMKAKVQVTIDVGFRIKSEISLRSFIDLNLMEGKKVHVQFKVKVSIKCDETD